MKLSLSKSGMNNLNLIRTLSGFIVLAAHFSQIFILPFYGLNCVSTALSKLSLYAVLAFFILSGLLIALSIDTNVLRHNGKFELKNYAVSRIGRIYPPLIFSIVLCFLPLHDMPA